MCIRDSYTIVALVLFGVLNLMYGTCQGAIINLKLNEPNDGKSVYCGCFKTKENIKLFSAFGIPLFVLLILIFVGMITAALVVVPISKAFTDASNRLVGFYQSVIFLVGAYLIYKKVSKKKPETATATEREAEPGTGAAVPLLPTISTTEL